MIGKTIWIVKAVLLFGVMASLASALRANAQAGDWTWTDGSSTVGSTCLSTYPCGRSGVYGTKGTSASANLPGSRIQPVSWTDASGTKWLFGGFGYDGSGGLGELNDLWQTNSSGNAWTWISGANGAGHSGVYGTQGTASASNVPGGRGGAASWTDKSGNLWLFGGLGYDGTGTNTYGYENDLWMYNATTNQWTWESGSSTVPPPQTTFFGTFVSASAGVYGTMGTPASGNTPGGRMSATTWVDSSGNLWLFGGGFTDSSGYVEVYNDLWKFNTTTKQWTWMEGSSSSGATDQTGVYGTFQMPASGNIPGSRYLASGWTDSGGNFWLFGGSGYASNAGQYNLNDLWKYSPSSGQWTWMGGAGTLYPCNFLFSTPCPVPGTYGTKGTAASTNFPGARQSALTWNDSTGNLWLFGGSGQDANNNGAWLNDLWEYNPSTTYWTWIGGSSTIPTSCTTGNCGQPGVYGTLGTAASANVPGARVSSVAWTDQSGDFWLFGGQGEDSAGATGYLNDMWEYQPSAGSSPPTAATPTFSVPAGSYSSAQTVTLSDSTSGATIYYTTNGTTPTTSSSVYSTPISVSSTETLEAIAGASGYTSSAVASAAYTITQSTAPAVTLSPAGPLSFTTPSGTSSATQTVTLTNSGTAALTGITAGIRDPNGVFTGSFNCPSTLAAGASCTITIGFTAPFASPYTGALVITDNASNSPQSITLNGTGTGTLAPVANIFPTSLTFAATLVNTTNTGQSITLANSGTAPMTGITASIIGANASNFAITSNTCSSLGLGATCTISVSFTPPATGPFNATLSIADNAGNSPQSVPLSGTGTTTLELASISPSLLKFANQPVNTTSGAVTATLSNVGSAALTSISPAITGAGASAFAISATTCGTSLAAGANCTLSITFTPSSTATFNATLTVTDGASNSPHLVPLSGTGTPASSTSAATLSTTSLSFPNTAVGASSPLSVTVTNSGSQALSIGGILFGDTYQNEVNSLSAAQNVFTQTSTCGATLAPGASCIVTVTFAPMAGSLYSGTLLIADSSSSLTQAVSLIGVGTGGSGAAAVLSPPLNFGTLAVGTTSAPMTTTLTNTGSVTLTGITPTLSGSYASYFAISATTCGSTLAAGASCTISIKSTSARAVTYAANLMVADSAPGSPQLTTLTGSSDPLCPMTAGNNCNPGGSTIVTSTFGVALVFNPPTVSPATATAASTEIVGRYQGTVVYDQTFPAAYGAPTVQAGVTAANAAIVAAGGSGANIPAPALTSSSTSTSTASTSVFSRDPAAPVATTGSTTTFGPATILAGGADVSSNPSPTVGQLTECTEATLPSSAAPTCYATNPGLIQVLAGQLDINLNTTLTYFIDTTTTATTTTTTATSYSINGTAATAPAVLITPAGPLSFSAITGTTSAAQTVTITNSGSASLSFTGFSITGTNASSFAETNTCGGALSAGTTCTVSITFSPGATGSYTAALAVADNASGSPQAVTLNGTGNAPAAPAVMLTPAGPLAFSATSGTTSVAQAVTLTNPGNATLAIAGIAITGTNASSFAETNTCGTSLAAAGSCTISITFAPASATTFSAAATVTDNATGSPQTVSLNGTGTAPVPSFSISSPTPTQSVVAGSAATYLISVTPQNGAFNSPITFSLSGLPSGATAIFNPVTVTPGSSATSTTLTITSPATALLHPPFELPAGTRPITLAFLVLLFLPRKRNRRQIWLGLMLMVSLGAATILSGCAGGFATPGPASTTYNVTVTAAGGSVQQTTTLQLTVKQ